MATKVMKRSFNSSIKHFKHSDEFEDNKEFFAYVICQIALGSGCRVKERILFNCVVKHMDQDGALSPETAFMAGTEALMLSMSNTSYEGETKQ